MARLEEFEVSKLRRGRREGGVGVGAGCAGELNAKDIVQQGRCREVEGRKGGRRSSEGRGRGGEGVWTRRKREERCLLQPEFAIRRG
eukprot:669891-Hanusia_phi.AAC.5